jgi:predicted metal-dependent phosphoesterase TrpH
MMWQIETHCHTLISEDSLVRPADLVAAARRKGLDRVVITDHNSITGALAAQAIDPELVIVGEEIMTRQGEILAFFVQEQVPPGLEALQTIDILSQQEAFISVSHPFDLLRGGRWELSDLEAIAPLVDAVEVLNARCMHGGYNEQAQTFARLHDLPGTAGSDAHALFELGRARLLTPPFENAAELRGVIREAQVQGRLSPPWVHLASRYAVWRKRLG